MLRFAVAAAALVIGAAAHAQFPSRPIHILVTIPPGGAPDIVARVVGEKISHTLGQPVVIDNKPAANGNAAATEVAHAAPDGHTLLLGADSLIVINPHVYSSMAIDPLKDLTPISSLVSNQFVLSIDPRLPPKTFPEFIEYAKKANPPLAYASGGNGSQHQLTMEMLKELESPDVKASLLGKGSLETLILSPEDFEKLIRRDYDKYGKLIQKLG